MSRDNDREPSSINKIELLGRLGRDPEVRSVGRSELCTLSLATSESWKDKKTGEWQSVTQWHTVTTFDDEHIAVAEKLKKGDLVYVVGILTYRTWEDRDGNKKYFTEIQLKKWHELERREKAPGRDGTGATRGRDRDDRGRGDDRNRDGGRDRGRGRGDDLDDGDDFGGARGREFNDSDFQRRKNESARRIDSGGDDLDDLLGEEAPF